MEDDSVSHVRVVTGGCGNTSRIALLPPGWVVVRDAGEKVERGRAPNTAAATVAVADSGTTASFSVIPLPDADYVASTTKVPLGETAYITDGTLGISLSAAPNRTPLGYNLVDPDTGFWTTWSSPPYSESATPWYMEFGDWFDVPVTLNMSLSRPVTTFGFEVEPAPWAVRSFDVSYFASDTLLGTVSMSVDGYGGARLVAIRSTRPFDSVSVVSNSDFAIAQVRYAATIQPSLVVACVGTSGVPGPITRSATVRCTATVTPPAAYSVVRRRAILRDTNVVVVDTTLLVAVDAGASYEWTGEAVASTDVLIAVNVPQPSGDTLHFSYETSYTVAPRTTWPVPVLMGLMGPWHALGPPESRMHDYPDDSILGAMKPDLPPYFVTDDPLVGGSQVARPTDGPNVGVGYLSNPFTDGGYTVWRHPGLDAIPSNVPKKDYTGAQKWHADQNGTGGGTCRDNVWPKLIQEVERHEGVTQADSSHWGIAMEVYRTSDLHKRLERVYLPKTLNDPAADDRFLRNNVAGDVWLKFHNDSTDAYQRAQRRFDTSDYPKINTAIGCYLDYSLLNP